MNPPRGFLEKLYATAVAAAHPAACLTPHLPAAPSAGRLIVLAAGKAAGSMTEIAERHYLETAGFPADRTAGIAVCHRRLGPELRQPWRGRSRIGCLGSIQMRQCINFRCGGSHL